MITVPPNPASRIPARKARPSITGIFRSQRMKSKRRSPARRSPSLPSAAVVTA